MKISKELLLSQASVTGFHAEILEKIFHLFSLLEGFRDHPALKDKLALKGGTALNLFIFNIPRLSVDIDLNYIGDTDLTGMQNNRPEIERAIIAVCEREGLAVRRIPTEHAGGKWQLQYASALGQGGSLEVDINFLLRVPLWPVRVRDSQVIGFLKVEGVPVLDVHELAAGKLAALFARNASRDLFDAWKILRDGNLDPDKLRLGFVVYAGANRKDFRLVKISDAASNPKELSDHLLPVLSASNIPQSGEVRNWGLKMEDECQKALETILPFNANERQFLDALNGNGEIHPELLTTDPLLHERILHNPALQWKAKMSLHK